MIKVFGGEHVWRVGVTLPKDETKGRRYALTRTLMVIAGTAERAIECAREHYGECAVYSVQHHAGNDSAIVVAAEVLTSHDHRCTCAAIQNADPTRHFRECPLRVQYPDR